MHRPPPRSTLFPYTTLFRSWIATLPSITAACLAGIAAGQWLLGKTRDRKSTRLNSSHQIISYAVFCLKKKKKNKTKTHTEQINKLVATKTVSYTKKVTCGNH